MKGLSPDCNYLKNSNTVKVSNSKNPFYYHDLFEYLKNQNRNIPKLKNETKTIYQVILLNGEKHPTFRTVMYRNKRITYISQNSRKTSTSLASHLMQLTNYTIPLPCTIKTNHCTYK